MKEEIIRRQPQAIQQNPSDVSRNISEEERVYSAIAGGALALLGLSRRSTFGALLMVLGGSLAYRGASGHCPVYEQMGIDTSNRGRGSQAGPSSQHGQSRMTQQPVDDVEEAAMESFPASDPPAHSRSTIPT